MNTGIGGQTMIACDIDNHQVNDDSELMMTKSPSWTA